MTTNADMSKVRNDNWAAFDESGVEAGWEHHLHQGILSGMFKPSAYTDFRNPEVYRAAMIEGLTSAAYVFLSLCTAITCLQSNFPSNLLAIACFHVILISFFIYSSMQASGGHFNPLITVTTMLTGHCSIPRSVLYVLFQLLGAIVGAGAVKAIIDKETARKYALGGCQLRQEVTTNGIQHMSGLDAGQGFISEFIFSFVYIHIIYTMGIDPKQQPSYGAVLGPLFCGVIVGTCIFISGNLKAGYVGAGFNPARCLGAAVAEGHETTNLWRDYWVYLLGPLAASIFQAILWHLIPFDHTKLYLERQSSLQIVVRAIKEKKEGSTRHGSMGSTKHSSMAPSRRDASRTGPNGGVAESPDV